MCAGPRSVPTAFSHGGTIPSQGHHRQRMWQFQVARGDHTKSCTVSDTATAANGCDSIVTLHLTVTSSAPRLCGTGTGFSRTGQPLDVSQYATATGWQKRDPNNNWKSLNVADAVTCDMSIDSVRYYSTNAWWHQLQQCREVGGAWHPTVDIYGTSLTLCANTHVLFHIFH